MDQIGGGPQHADSVVDRIIRRTSSITRDDNRDGNTTASGLCSFKTTCGTSFNSPPNQTGATGFLASTLVLPAGTELQERLRIYVRQMESVLAEVESGALNQETNEEIEMRNYEMRDWYDRFMTIYEGGIAASSTEEKATMRTMFMGFSSVYRRCMGLVNSRLKANATIAETHFNDTQRNSQQPLSQRTQADQSNTSAFSKSAFSTAATNISSGLVFATAASNSVGQLVSGRLEHPVAMATTQPAPINNGNFNAQPSGLWKLPGYKFAEITFDGNPQEWPTFKNTFANLYTTTPTERFHYLMTMLKGDAKNVLYGLTVNNQEDYDVVWSTLCQRFENKIELVGCQLDRFLELPSIVEESADDLRKVVDTTRGMIRALQLLQVETDAMDVLVNHLIVQKMNDLTLLDWNKERRGQLTTTERFMEFLDQRARSIGSVHRPNTAPAGGKNHHAESSCIVCTGRRPHPLTECRKFMAADPHTRHQWIKSSSVCYVCLKDGHTITDCAALGCSFCGRDHHDLLCFRRCEKYQGDDFAR